MRIQILLMLAFWLPLLALPQAADLPPQSDPGQCFARVLVPEVSEVITEQIVDEPPTTEVKVIPATYQTVTEQILVRESSISYEVIPAVYKTVTQEVIVEPERTVQVVVPAKYESYTEEVLVRPAYTTWKPGSGLFGRDPYSGNGEDLKSDEPVVTGELICRVEIPAEYETVTRTRLISPETTEERLISAVTRTLTKEVLVQPARVDERVIPAVYETVTTQKIVTPAIEEIVVLPATYKTIEKRVVSGGGGLEWREVLCDSNTDPALISEIQQALGDAGYDSAIDGQFGPSTLSAMEAYQRANGLPVGYLTTSTASSLGVSAKGGVLGVRPPSISETNLFIQDEEQDAESTRPRNWLHAATVAAIYKQSGGDFEQTAKPTRAAAVSFHHPKYMIVGDTYGLTSMIALKGRSESRIELKRRLSSLTLQNAEIDEEQDQLAIEFIEAGSKMKATITGLDFEIEEDAAARIQSLNLGNENSLAQWYWQVRPKKEGQLELHVKLDSIADDGSLSFVASFRRKIRVLPKIQRSVKNEFPSEGLVQPAMTIPENVRCKTYAPGMKSQRHALVIANQSYSDELGALENTLQDGINMRQSLQAAGYHVVHCEDITMTEMDEQVDFLVRNLLEENTDRTSESVGIFYYSGHGVSLDRPDGEEAFLLPLDFRSSDMPTVADEAVSLDKVWVKLASARPDHLVLLFDACRELRDQQVNAVAKGLKQPEWETNRQTNVFLGYADKFGKKTADDGQYSGALSRVLGSQSVDILDWLNLAQNDVIERTAGRKWPQYEDFGTAEFMISLSPK